MYILQNRFYVVRGPFADVHLRKQRELHSKALIKFLKLVKIYIPTKVVLLIVIQ